MIIYLDISIKIVMILFHKLNLLEVLDLPLMKNDSKLYQLPLIKLMLNKRVSSQYSFLRIYLILRREKSIYPRK